MEKQRALLLVMTDIPPEWEAEFNDWYDTEHIAERLSVPGFLTARRFLALDGAPKYLALYDVEDESVLRSEGYLYLLGPGATPRTQRLRPHFQNFTRNIYQETLVHPPQSTDAEGAAANALLLVMQDVMAEREEEYHAWYNTEHLPSLLSVPGFLRGRRFLALEGSPKYLALYDLKDEGTLQTEAYFKARESPWTSRVRGFITRRIRNVYRRIY